MSEQSPTYFDSAPLTPEALLDSPSVSTWLKDALRSALRRDPVDAAKDAELLSSVLGARADGLLGVDAARLGVRLPCR